MSEDEDRKRLTSLWQSAVQEAPGSAEQMQAFGRNFRLDLGKALAAVAATATAISTATRGRRGSDRHSRAASGRVRSHIGRDWGGL
jgi:hypothetical protein